MGLDAGPPVRNLGGPFRDAGRPPMTYAERIRTKLTGVLAPVRLSIVDDSHRHAGHAGHDARGETHFDVTVVSAVFAGKSRVARQRLVYEILSAELSERIHALALRTLTPEEDG